MSWPAALLIVLVTTALMEAVAYGAHRWVMHGVGWSWHRDHHEPHNGWFERNDRYALVFALLAIGLLASDLGRTGRFWVGAGMTLYGLLYALMHDGLVHHRFPTGWIGRPAYLARVIQAHHLHHAVHARTGCVSFGFLYAPPIARLRARLHATPR